MKRVLRVVFSRYFISALFILLEISFIFGLIAYAGAYSLPVFILLIFINLITVISLINRDANPEYKVSWLVVVLLLPIFGMVLYFLFYSRREPKRRARLMQTVYERLNGYAEDGAMRCEEDEDFEALKREGTNAHGKALALLTEDPLSRIYRETEATYFDSAEAMLDSMLCDLEGAQRFIFLEYFIIGEGVMWQKILDVLAKKVQSGVEVRVLYDDIGCMKTLPRGYEKTLSDMGIKATCFSKVTPRAQAVHNNRDHRKILVIDGRCAYTGGVNIADEYINEKERFGHWKDGGIRLYGRAAEGFLRLFLSAWSLTLGEDEDYSKYISQSSAALKSSPLPSTSNTDTQIQIEIAENSHTGGTKARKGGYFIPFGTGPAPLYKSPVGKNAIETVINQAESYVYITTPYLIIDYDLTEAIKAAAMRGVDVRIVTPGIPDKKIVNLMTKSSYAPLLENGVRIYEYTPGFIHEKMLISDEDYAIFGTINLDYRSLVHHFEDAVWIYKNGVIADMKSGFLNTLSLSKEIKRGELKLTPVQRFVRSMVRIFAPLM